MIVVEGPDGSGKTTMVERLKSEFALEQIPRAANSDAEYTQPLDEWVDMVQMRAREGIILDRHQLISHLMYGPTMRRVLYGNFQNVFWLNHRLELFWESKPIVVLCLPPLDEVKANLEVDEHKVAQADIEVFYWNYHAFLANHLHDDYLLHWDYTQGEYEELKGMIYALLMKKGIR